MLEKYQNLLKELKKISRCNSIHLWHEETLGKMKLNYFQLRKKVKNYV